MNNDQVNFLIEPLKYYLNYAPNSAGLLLSLNYLVLSLTISLLKDYFMDHQ